MSTATTMSGMGGKAGGAGGSGGARGKAGVGGAGGAKNEQLKRNAMYAAAAVLVLAMGAMGYWMWTNRTPAPTAAPALVAKFVGSDQFLALPEKKQLAYLDTLEKNREAFRDLPDEQRRAAWENLREVRENQMLNRYFAATPAERQKILDEEIKRQEERRKEWQARAGQRPQGQPGQGGPRGPRGGDQAARQKSRLENRSPERRAQSAQYRADVAARRAQLGLPSFGPGGPGGGRR